MNDELLDRLAAVILTGVEELWMDLVTDCGRFTLDPEGKPNSKQNGMGSLLQQAGTRGWLVNTHRTRKSESPRRKGGADAIWSVTDLGRTWASRRINNGRLAG